jgi:nucleoside-diphosphate-sugar epimerase
MRNRIIEEDLEYIISADLPWDLLEGKTIFISGANGFLPAYMVETILYLNEKCFDKKARVIGLVRNKEKALKRFSHYRGRKDLIFQVQDVCSSVVVEENVDYIIHAASQASPKYYGKDPLGTLSANVIGTNNLLSLASKKRSEGFLFFSSGEVYGEVPERDMPIKEDCYGYVDPMQLRSCYAEGKRAGENMCLCWHHQHGVPVKIVRPFHTYGPGMRLDDGRVYADFVSDIVSNKNIVMKSDGRAKRPFCYLADATLGFYTVLLKGRDAEAYNVGDKNGEISIRELAEMLLELFPEKNLSIETSEETKKEGYIKSRIIRHTPDTSKISGLGWSPKYSLKEGFKRTVRSFL